MKIKFENEILQAGVRKQLIQEINGSENLRRKDEAYRRYLCYKDQTNRFVVEHLLRQFEMDTVSEMRYGIANLSVVKKIVDKLARVYSHGVSRTIDGDEKATDTLQKLEKALSINTEMKKANRFLKLQKNIAFFVKPCPVYSNDGKSVEWTLKLEPLNPHHYDVVEDFYDKTKPLIYILSDYDVNIKDYSSLDVGIRPVAPSLAPKGDSRDQKIADTPEDTNKGSNKRFVFWSANYHFTCDESGEIIIDPGNNQAINPFAQPMIINMAIDQDGSFWAQGGEDLIDGGVLINSMLTHLNHIGVLQSYGQFYMSGENLPRQVKIGANKALIMEYKKDEQAEPKAGFLNANPQLDSLRGCIEAYLALLLTTNNLSTSGVSAQLSGGKELASGIALVIDKAESQEDVQDQRQLFIDKEPKIWNAIGAFLKVYGASAVQELRGLVLPENLEQKFTIKFQDASSIMSEKEKLEIYKLREELGLDTMITLLMKDDPSLTEDQAEKKMLKLIEQKIKVLMAENKAKAASGLPSVDEAGNEVDPETGEPIEPQDPENKEDTLNEDDSDDGQ